MKSLGRKPEFRCFLRDIFTGFESKIFSVLFILCVYYNKFLQELIYLKN